MGGGKPVYVCLKMCVCVCVWGTCTQGCLCVSVHLCFIGCIMGRFILDPHTVTCKELTTHTHAHTHTHTHTHTQTHTHTHTELNVNVSAGSKVKKQKFTVHFLWSPRTQIAIA